MRTGDERSALDHPMSLLEHATRLYERHPDGPLPDGGSPYPDDYAPPPQRQVPADKCRATLSALLEAFLADASAGVEDLHEDLCQFGIPEWMVESTLVGLPTADVGRARQTGRWLVRHATDRGAVMVGLVLLTRTAEPEDVPAVRLLGLLELFDTIAVKVVAAVPGTAPDLIWLAERSTRSSRGNAVKALSQQGDPEGVAWLLRYAVEHDELSASSARRVAETVSLADALDAADVEVEVLDQAGRLLLAMATPNDYRTQLARYSDACRAHRLLAGHLANAPASLVRLTMVVSLIEDLCTGHAACLDWPPDERLRVLDELCTTVARDDWQAHLAAALGSADPLVRRRAEWARAAIGATRPGGTPGLRIHVAAPDLSRSSDVETRVVVDGLPVIAAYFDKGPPDLPEALLGRGALRATSKPHDVRLAEAYCSEGCCGALYVSIVRDGDSVVWRDWRGYSGDDPPPEMRFCADLYDAEVSRAEGDFSWEWPARTIARLVRARFAAEPELLTRWRCHPWWLAARSHEPSQVSLSFSYPEPPGTTDERPWVQFEQTIALDDKPAAEQAARIVEQLRTVDPKTQAIVVGGHRDYADQLGYPQD